MSDVGSRPADIGGGDDGEPELSDAELRALYELQSSAGDRDAAALDVGGNIVRWRDLDARNDVDMPEVWSELRSFVDWLIFRYEIPRSQIPDCWYRHGALVEELSALQSSWTASFDDMDSGHGPIGFHERLAQARGRVETHYAKGTCDRGHVDPPERIRESGETYEKDFARWMRDSHATWFTPTAS